MNKTSNLIFAVALAAGVAAAQVNQNLYTSWSEWQWTPVAVADTNALENARAHFDFTKPTHGPWLLNPGETRMTIGFVTQLPCGAGLEYRVKGTEEWTRQWGVDHSGYVDYSSDNHLFHLSGLQPATTYEYRILTDMNAPRDVHRGEKGQFTGREIYTFSTIDQSIDHYLAWGTSDLHGGGRADLEVMIRSACASNALVHFYVGDNVEDNLFNARLYITQSFLDDTVRLWGDRPTIFCRGNHDAWGEDINKWQDYFGAPGGRCYWAYRQGPVLWIQLDISWGNGISAACQDTHDAYIRQQAEWLRELKKTDDWKKAKFRIAMAHHGFAGASKRERMNKLLRDVLDDDSRKGRLHLFMSGHEHCYRRIAAGSQVCKVYPPNKNDRFISDYHFNCLVLHHIECLTIEVAPEKLVFRSHFFRKGDGKELRDAFELYPDGSIKDLMEVPEYPIPLPEEK